MATIQTKYGSEDQTLTITLTSLASGSAREGTAIDNSSNKFLDVLVMVKVRFANTAPTGDKRVYIYAAGTVDSTSPEWPDAVTGTDAAITLDSPTQLKLIGAIEAAQNLTRKSEPMSVAQAFGGLMPVNWDIIILNSSGAALTATASDHTVKYQGISAEAV